MVTYYFLVDVGDGHCLLKYGLHFSGVLGVHLKVPYRGTNIRADLLGGKEGGEGDSGEGRGTGEGGLDK